MSAAGCGTRARAVVASRGATQAQAAPSAPPTAGCSPSDAKRSWGYEVAMNALRQAVARASLVAAIVLCLSRIAVAGNLCPPPEPLPPETDDMRMKEIEFNSKEVADGLRHLEDDAPQILIDKGRTGSQSTESLLGYYNYLKTIRGYVLRQEALLRLVERDLLIERNRRGRASKADVAAAKVAFDEAKARFCEFVKNAYYSD